MIIQSMIIEKRIYRYLFFRIYSPLSFFSLKTGSA